MPTVAVTGSASGIGAACADRLARSGSRVIGMDRREADVVADLGTAEGRQVAVEAVAELSGGSLDGLVTCAGLAGATPELLIRREGDRVHSLVLAGTAPRGRNAAQDDALGAALLSGLASPLAAASVSMRARWNHSPPKATARPMPTKDVAAIRLPSTTGPAILSHHKPATAPAIAATAPARTPDSALATTTPGTKNMKVALWPSSSANSRRMPAPAAIAISARASADENDRRGRNRLMKLGRSTSGKALRALSVG